MCVVGVNFVPEALPKEHPSTHLLKAIRHSPPLPHLGVLAHALHVAGVVEPDVLERREQDAGAGVMENAI